MAIAKAKWFNYEFYMNNKLAQMQESDPSYTMDKLVSAFNNAGFTGEEGAYKHFQKYGHKEDVSPNSLFDADYYYQSKAYQFYQLKENGGLSTDQIKANMDLYAANIKNAISKAGMDAWTHYIKYGTAENINPSSGFNTKAYIEAKYAAWSATSAGKGKSIDDMLKAFKSANLNAVEHAVQYGTDPTTATAGEVQCWTNTAHTTLADEFASNDDPTDPTVGETFTLTTGVDTFTGTDADDTFNAPLQGNSPTLTGLDTLDGKGGEDTLNVEFTGAVTAIPGKISNIEIFNLINNNGAFTLDLSKASGLTNVNLQAQSNTGQTVTVADDVVLSVVAAGGAVTTNGGKEVTVETGNNSGTVAVSGEALESVSITGGNANTISNGATGTTLKSVTLTGVTGGVAQIQGKAIEELTLKNIDNATAQTYAIQNTTTKNTLNLNVEDAGYNAKTNAETMQTVDTSTGAFYSDVELSAEGTKNAVTLAGGAKLQTVSVSGKGGLALTVTGTTVTSIDASGAEGDIALVTTGQTALTEVATGAGNDTWTTTGTAVKNIQMGAGNDLLTVDTALTAGTTILLGDGNDFLLKGAGSIASSNSNVSKVDGGAGDDILSLSLVDNANAAIFTNFEYFDVAGMNSTFSMTTLGSNNVKGLVATDNLGGTNAAITGLGSTVSYDIQAALSGTNALTLTQATAGTVNVNINYVEAAADVTGLRAAVTPTNATTVNVDFETEWANAAGSTVGDNVSTLTVKAEKATSMTVTSSGENVGHNDLTIVSSASSTSADVLQSLTLRGDADLSLTYDPENTGNVGLSAITSSMTAGLTMDLTSLKATGTLTLGTGGDDVLTGITAVAKGTAWDNVRSVSGIELGSKAGFTSQDGFDVVSFGTSHAIATTGTTNFTVKNGIATIKDGGATYQSEAAALDALIAEFGATAGSVVAFQYTANSDYLLVDCASATTGSVVKLSGVTSLQGIDEVGTTDAFYAY